MEWHILATVLLPQWVMLALAQHLPLHVYDILLFKIIVAIITIITLGICLYHLRYTRMRSANKCLSDAQRCVCCVVNRHNKR